jgi:Cdc6-like AAA superfamily ATPase
MGRECKLIAVIGKKGVGKTVQTKKMMEEYVKGNPAKGVPPRRVLILDVNDEFQEYKAISLDDIALYSIHPTIEIRRVRPFHKDGKKMGLDDLANSLFIILDTYKNGMLLIEDVNKYISDTMPNDLIGAICTNRHIGVDIILHYQSIGRITTKVWQNLNILRIHKFTDTVKKHKQKFEDKFEYLSIAEILISQKHDAGEKYFYVYADIDEEKIFGAFTNQEFENAVNFFISHNYNNIVLPLLNGRDERGKRTYTPQTAIAEVKKRLMNYKR